MRDAALHLSFDEQRIDLIAAVVYRDVLRDRHLAGVAIDFDGADVRAEREREVLRLEEARGLEPRLEAGRQILREIRFGGELAPRDLTSRDARRLEFSVLEDDVIVERLEQVRRERLRFLDHLVDRHHDRGAADGSAAAAVRIAAVVRHVGVALEDRHVLDRHAKPIGDDLREARFLPLPVRRDAGDDRHGPERDVCVLRPAHRPV